MTPQDAAKQFQALPGGSLENVGAIIEEPGVFRIVGGQPFQTPFSVDCTKLTADAGGWQAALAAGAQRVAIFLPGQPRNYGGVLALCRIHSSASGPSSRSYSLVIPESKIPEAQDGLIASIAEQVTVNRQAPIDVGAALGGMAVANAMAGQTPGAVDAAAALRDANANNPVIANDFAWMLWFTDRPASMGVNFTVTGVQASVAAPPPVLRQPQAPTLTKGGTYTAMGALNLRAGPSTSAAVVTLLNAGDAVVASGDSKNGFWSVTTVAGQSGWVYASNLKAN